MGKRHRGGGRSGQSGSRIRNDGQQHKFHGGIDKRPAQRVVEVDIGDGSERLQLSKKQKKMAKEAKRAEAKADRARARNAK